MLRFHYNQIVGFCKPCGLLEHRLNSCGSLVAAALEEVANPCSNSNPNLAPIFGSRQGSLSPSPSLGFSVKDAGLVFKAQFAPQGVVPLLHCFSPF
ncbi:hypothetical protein M0R45_025147 [Rubus argutus]|uniref:Uncharacterized protein n=1 Tax=Rubus argutus TaxID=59490 RepID=A0AAW1WW65_RUBAR